MTRIPPKGVATQAPGPSLEQTAPTALEGTPPLAAEHPQDGWDAAARPQTAVAPVGTPALTQQGAPQGGALALPPEGQVQTALDQYAAAHAAARQDPANAATHLAPAERQLQELAQQLDLALRSMDPASPAFAQAYEQAATLRDGTERIVIRTAAADLIASDTRLAELFEAAHSPNSPLGKALARRKISVEELERFAVTGEQSEKIQEAFSVFEQRGDVHGLRVARAVMFISAGVDRTASARLEQLIAEEQAALAQHREQLMQVRTEQPRDPARLERLTHELERGERQLAAYQQQQQELMKHAEGKVRYARSMRRIGQRNRIHYYTRDAERTHERLQQATGPRQERLARRLERRQNDLAREVENARTEADRYSSTIPRGTRDALRVSTQAAAHLSLTQARFLAEHLDDNSEAAEEILALTGDSRESRGAGYYLDLGEQYVAEQKDHPAQQSLRHAQLSLRRTAAASQLQRWEADVQQRSVAVPPAFSTYADATLRLNNLLGTRIAALGDREEAMALRQQRLQLQGELLQLERTPSLLDQQRNTLQEALDDSETVVTDLARPPQQESRQARTGRLASLQRLRGEQEQLQQAYEQTQGAFDTATTVRAAWRDEAARLGLSLQPETIVATGDADAAALMSGNLPSQGTAEAGYQIGRWHVVASALTDADANARLAMATDALQRANAAFDELDAPNDMLRLTQLDANTSITSLALQAGAPHVVAEHFSAAADRLGARGLPLQPMLAERAIASTEELARSVGRAQGAGAAYDAMRGLSRSVAAELASADREALGVDAAVARWDAWEQTNIGLFSAMQSQIARERESAQDLYTDGLRALDSLVDQQISSTINVLSAPITYFTHGTTMKGKGREVSRQMLAYPLQRVREQGAALAQASGVWLEAVEGAQAAGRLGELLDAMRTSRNATEAARRAAPLLQALGIDQQAFDTAMRSRNDHTAAQYFHRAEGLDAAPALELTQSTDLGLMEASRYLASAVEHEIDENEKLASAWGRRWINLGGDLAVAVLATRQIALPAAATRVPVLGRAITAGQGAVQSLARVSPTLARATSIAGTMALNLAAYEGLTRGTESIFGRHSYAYDLAHMGGMMLFIGGARGAMEAGRATQHFRDTGLAIQRLQQHGTAFAVVGGAIGAGIAAGHYLSPEWAERIQWGAMIALPTLAGTVGFRRHLHQHALAVRTEAIAQLPPAEARQIRQLTQRQPNIEHLSAEQFAQRYQALHRALSQRNNPRDLPAPTGTPAVVRSISESEALLWAMQHSNPPRVRDGEPLPRQDELNRFWQDVERHVDVLRQQGIPIRPESMVLLREKFNLWLLHHARRNAEQGVQQTQQALRDRPGDIVLQQEAATASARSRQFDTAVHELAGAMAPIAPRQLVGRTLQTEALRRLDTSLQQADARRLQASHEPRADASAGPPVHQIGVDRIRADASTGPTVHQIGVDRIHGDASAGPSVHQIGVDRIRGDASAGPSVHQIGVDRIRGDASAGPSVHQIGVDRIRGDASAPPPARPATPSRGERRPAPATVAEGRREAASPASRAQAQSASAAASDRGIAPPSNTPARPHDGLANLMGPTGQVFEAVGRGLRNLVAGLRGQPPRAEQVPELALFRSAVEQGGVNAARATTTSLNNALAQAQQRYARVDPAELRTLSEAAEQIRVEGLRLAQQVPDEIRRIHAILNEPRQALAAYTELLASTSAMKGLRLHGRAQLYWHNAPAAFQADRASYQLWARLTDPAMRQIEGQLARHLRDASNQDLQRLARVLEQNPTGVGDGLLKPLQRELRQRGLEHGRRRTLRRTVGTGAAIGGFVLFGAPLAWSAIQVGITMSLMRQVEQQTQPGLDELFDNPQQFQHFMQEMGASEHDLQQLGFDEALRQHGGW